jgi:hypothetical protein
MTGRRTAAGRGSSSARSGVLTGGVAFRVPPTRPSGGIVREGAFPAAVPPTPPPGVIAAPAAGPGAA